MKGDAPAGQIGIFNELTQVYDVYNLRRRTLRIPYCRTRQYKQTFFPFALHQWNLISNDVNLDQSVKQFKSYLKKMDKPKKNILFYYGKRKLNIYHSRIRMGCSALNGHLSMLLHVKDNPKCECGFAVETPRHYFIDCPLYAGPR